MATDAVGEGAGGPTGVRWRIIGLLMVLGFMNYFNRICMPVAGERIMREYPIGEVRMGWVYSALLITYTAFMVPGGWLSDRIGGRKALTILGFGTAAAGALTGLAGHPALAVWMVWPLLLAIRATFGVFTTPFFPASGRVVGHWFPFRGRALANGLIAGAGVFGVALANPLFSALMGRVGWPTAFAITGLITAAIASAWAWYGRDHPKQHPGVNRAELDLIADLEGPRLASVASPSDAGDDGRNLLRNRSLWLLTASYATIGYVEYLVFYWSGHYFKEVLKFGESAGRVATMLPPLMMGLALPLGGALADRLVARVGYRWGRASVAMAGMVACGALVCLGTATAGPFAIVACFALALAAIGLAEGAAWPTAVDLGGSRGATSSAVVNTGGNFGGILSPVVTPWVGALLTPALGRELGWAWGVRLGGLLCLLGAGLWFWIDAGERGRPRAPEPRDEPELALEAIR